MSQSPFHDLSKRERQIMEIVQRKGEAAVSEVHEAMVDETSYNAIRVTMTNLEQKGYLHHIREGRRYLYRPVQRPRRMRRSAARHLLSTFFSDSVPDAVSSLLDAKTNNLTSEDFDRLQAMLDDARRKQEKRK